MKDARYRPPAALLDRIAPTENDPWRGRVVRGEVHDENALALGGVAPHAGLFATAPDLAHLAQALLDGGVFGGRRIVSRATVELFTERAGIPVSSRALGWDTPTDESGQRSSTPGQPGYSSAGSLFSARSFGHTGFTGTSMWMDPAARAVRHPAHEPRAPDPREQQDPRHEGAGRRRGRARAGPAVRRRAFLAATALPLAARRSLAASPLVLVGLERVAADPRARLRGRRVGLLAHAASVTADGRHAIDVLRGAGVDVVRLFGPEHGLRGRAAAGEEVAGGFDAASGLPVVSLYGARTKPTAEDLRGLDVLVVDLQDAGVRFYTYASTMLLCLEAAAEAGLEVVVLDRPNPLGGDRVEGPERDPAMPFSLVSVAPGPLVHGLTLGEMALVANSRREKPGRVSVRGDERLEAGHDLGRHRPALGQPLAEPAQRRGGARLPRDVPGGGDERQRGAGHGGAVPARGRPVDEGGGGGAGGGHPGLRAGADRLHARGFGGGAAAEAPRGSLPGCSRAGDATPPRCGPGPSGSGC